MTFVQHIHTLKGECSNPPGETIDVNKALKEADNHAVYQWLLLKIVKKKCKNAKRFNNFCCAMFYDLDHYPAKLLKHCTFLQNVFIFLLAL